MSEIFTSKWFLFLWLPFGLLLLAILAFLYWTVSQYDDQTLPPDAPKTAIVLGAALWDNNPSPALKERLSAAIQLVRKGNVNRLILSGGLGRRDQLTEAEAMRDYLTARGIPESMLVLEEKATNTWENLQFSAKLIPDSKRVLVITHDYHMFRAVKIAKQIGIEPVPYPVHTQVLFRPFHKIRECFALIKYYVSGKLPW